MKRTGLDDLSRGLTAHSLSDREMIEAISTICRLEDQHNVVQAYVLLSEEINQGNSGKVLDAIMTSEAMLSNDKHQVVDIVEKLINQDKGSVFYDYIVSCIAERNINPGSQGAKGVNLLDTFIQAVVDAPSAKEPSESQTSLKQLMNKAVQSVKSSSHPRAFAVRQYVKFEENAEKREKFAVKQLNKYIESLTTTDLNPKEKEEISKNIIAIMEPICSDKEKAHLKTSVNKLVRECAQHAGQKMSFAEAWQAYIVEPIKQLLGRENGLASFEKQSQVIGEAIKAKVSPYSQHSALQRIHERGARSSKDIIRF